MTCEDDSVSHDTRFPPLHRLETLQQWVADFVAEGNTNGANVNAVAHHGEDDESTGLVVMHLRHADALVYMQPRGFDNPLWEMTLTARDSDATMPPSQMAALGAEVVVAANLCTYLQYRSLDADRDSGRRSDATAG